MKIIIHRGTHQIGGIATEISTDTTRIIIDMGDELSLDPDFVSTPLDIAGVTDTNGTCDAVLFTHHHGDHVGQMMLIREEIPLYTGALAKGIMLLSKNLGYRCDPHMLARLSSVRTFAPGKQFSVGDIVHKSACLPVYLYDTADFSIMQRKNRCSKIVIYPFFILYIWPGGRYDEIRIKPERMANAL